LIAVGIGFKKREKMVCRLFINCAVAGPSALNGPTGHIAICQTGLPLNAITGLAQAAHRTRSM
jgi:hypothetical protein